MEALLLIALLAWAAFNELESTVEGLVLAVVMIALVLFIAM